MADGKEKKVGVEVYGDAVLHGKRAVLTRGENEVTGVLLANDHQKKSENMVFQFKDANGVSCVSPVTKTEMKNIEDYLIDY